MVCQVNWVSLFDISFQDRKEEDFTLTPVSARKFSFCKILIYFLFATTKSPLKVYRKKNFAYSLIFTMIFAKKFLNFTSF